MSNQKNGILVRFPLASKKGKKISYTIPFCDFVINKISEGLSIGYECFIFDDIQQMVDEIHKKESIDGLSRLVAGYAWEWLTNKDEKAFDIKDTPPRIQVLVHGLEDILATPWAELEQFEG